MPIHSNRRDFLSTVSLAGAGVALGGVSQSLLHAEEESSMPFKISVAEYSLAQNDRDGESSIREISGLFARKIRRRCRRILDGALCRQGPGPGLHGRNAQEKRGCGGQRAC